MTQAWGVAEIRAAEAQRLAQVAPDSLMQHASAALAVACARRLRDATGGVSGRRVVLLVGSGNNGGDALYAGMRLRYRGVAVAALLLGQHPHQEGLVAFRSAGGRVYCVGDTAVSARHEVHSGVRSETPGEGRGPDEAQREGRGEMQGQGEAGDDTQGEGGGETQGQGRSETQCQTRDETRSDIQDSTQLSSRVKMLLTQADLVVDGIAGLGGRPGLSPSAAQVMAAINPNASVVAVDIPSGLDPDSGAITADHVTADLTVSFGAAKPCLLLPPASGAAGEISSIDLGFRPYLPMQPLLRQPTAAEIARLWPVPSAGDDKYSRGVVGIIAGSTAYPGAAVLAVAGAIRAGAGMVRFIGPDVVTQAVRAAWPEVVAGPGKVQAWVIGPGMDPDAQDEPQLWSAVQALDGQAPVVVDAGALALLQQRRRPAPTLLTPHAGELARLLVGWGETATRDSVVADPLPAAQRAAALTETTVLLKGATTLVTRRRRESTNPLAAQHFQTYVVRNAPAWLATAGAGDVLAGVAGTLLAAGLSPTHAGTAAAYVHGAAAHLTNPGGPLTASEVAAAVPVAIAKLLAAR